jgi:DNA-binding beta-propeller fold protein YncE
LVNSDGTLSPIAGGVPANGGTLANPGQMAIAIDSTQSYLFVDDKTLGVVSVFFIVPSTGALAYSGTFTGSQSTSAIGIGSVINAGGVTGANYVLTANPNVNFVQPFSRTNATLTRQSAVIDSSSPTGLVVDPAGFFAYTGNSGNGTIALLGLQNTSQCGSAPVCVIQTFPSESPANSNAGTQFIATTH